MENAASEYGRGGTSAMCQETFCNLFSCCNARARSIMAGVASTPVAWRVISAKAQTTRPGPQATSSTVSAGPAPDNFTNKFNSSAFVISGAVANAAAFRVN